MENSVPFDHSCQGLVSLGLEIKFNMADPQASKYDISALCDKWVNNFYIIAVEIVA